LFVKGLSYFFLKFPFKKSINPIPWYCEFVYLSGGFDREGEGNASISGDIPPIVGKDGDSSTIN
jgi:hypothetical protein